MTKATKERLQRIPAYRPKSKSNLKETLYIIFAVVTMATAMFGVRECNYHKYSNNQNKTNIYYSGKNLENSIDNQFSCN